MAKPNFVRIMRRTIAVLAALFFAGSTFAQILPFEVLGLKEGLPQSQVICLAQDAEGYIWVGTLGGLARYNGDTFTVFGADSGLPSNKIQEVLADRSGTLWIATQTGVSRFRDHAMSRVDDPRLNGQRCRALAEDAQGGIWVGTETGAVVYGDGVFRSADPEGVVSRRVYDFLPEAEGVLASTTDGLIRYRRGQPPQVVPGPPVPTRSLGRTAEGLWVGTAGHGLWLQDATGWRRMELGGVQDPDVYRLSVERSGTLFVCTSNDGVYLRNPGATSFQHWSTGNGLPSDSTSCALEDREGNVWIGTDIGGLARLGGFAVVNYGTSTGLPNSCVFGIAPGPEPDSLWIATMRGAALLKVGPRPEVLEILTTAQGLDNDWIWKVFLTPQGELWVLTDFSWKFRRPGQKAFESPDPAVEFIRGNAMDMAVDLSGRLWIAGDDERGGLGMRGLDGRWRRWSQSDQGSLLNCRKLSARRSGGVWITQRNRILWSDGERVVTVPEAPPMPSQANITSILEDRAGRLWVGNDGGLAVREIDGRWRLLNETPGFSSHSVFSLGQDAEGVIWVGTARGVFRFQPDGVVSPLMPEDGLAGYESNANGFYCDPRGEVWIGTVDGMSRYQAVRDRPNQVAPRLVVESAEMKSGPAGLPGGVGPGVEGPVRHLSHGPPGVQRAPALQLPRPARRVRERLASPAPDRRTPVHQPPPRQAPAPPSGRERVGRLGRDRQLAHPRATALLAHLVVQDRRPRPGGRGRRRSPPMAAPHPETAKRGAGAACGFADG